MPDRPTNRLARALSPYLLQHRHNPVDWYEWGEEAFAEAKRRDCPVLLSIGYSTCHWCHVMEHESFEDEAVAAAINATFVPVKVDREERPDVDHTYMQVCHLAGGSCGWPLTVVLTPERLPFFVATYLPPRARGGRIGVVELAQRIGAAWRDDRERVEASAAELAQGVRTLFRGEPAAEAPGAQFPRLAFEGLRQRWDDAHGGFGTAPKFPTPHHLLFLLRYGDGGEGEATRMAVETLHAMRRGGIHDHVGGGFHRYSTDRHWLVPHFEKMLYDQALLLLAYAEGFRRTNDDRLRRTAEGIVAYLRRDLRAPEGAFYAAEDADSEGEEGRFYVWTPDELRAVLGSDAARVISTYGVTDEGNYLDEATRARTGASILHLPDAEVEPAFADAVRERLLPARAARPRPHLDDKILADWNGLAIGALARAGVLLEDPSMIDDAETAAAFVLSTLSPGGVLHHRYRDGEAGITAFLDDLGAMLWGCTSLYDATFDVRWLREARLLADRLEAAYRSDAGGYFLTASGEEAPLGRVRSYDEGAAPSGNALAAWGLARLARLTGDAELGARLDALLRGAGEVVGRYPAAFTGLLLATEGLGPEPVEVVVVGAGALDAARRLAAVAPDAAILARTPSAEGELARLAPFTAGMSAEGEGPTFYVCRAFACERPTNDEGAVRSTLAAYGPSGVGRTDGSGA